MKIAPCLLCFCLAYIVTPALAETKSVSCPPRTEFGCKITCNGVKAKVKCQGGGPVCECEAKGAQGGHIWIRCKYGGTKETHCGANERPGGHCRANGPYVNCINWAE